MFDIEIKKEHILGIVTYDDDRYIINDRTYNTGVFCISKPILDIFTSYGGKFIDDNYNIPTKDVIDSRSKILLDDNGEITPYDVINPFCELRVDDTIFYCTSKNNSIYRINPYNDDDHRAVFRTVIVEKLYPSMTIMLLNEAQLWIRTSNVGLATMLQMAQ